MSFGRPPPFSEWIWSPEHQQYYSYRYTDHGQTEFHWRNPPSTVVPRQMTRYQQIHSFPYDDGGYTPHLRGDVDLTSSSASTPRTVTTTNTASTATTTGSSPPPPRSAAIDIPYAERRRDAYGREDSVNCGNWSRQLSPNESSRPPAHDVRRFLDGDKVHMSIKERGAYVFARMIVRRGRQDTFGEWEYQLWRDNRDDSGLFAGGEWFPQRDLR